MKSLRIVQGKPGAAFALAARGRVLDEAFEICVSHEDAGRFSRFRIEDQLLEEAKSLIREADSLSSSELDHLMQ